MTEPQPAKSGSLFDIKWNETNEVPSVTEYRTLSIPCLLAFLFGLLSPLVLVSWGFVFVPILALVLGTLGLFGIAHSDGMRFGRPLAWSAVFLSICFVVMNVSLWQAYQNRIIREAMDFGEWYFEIYARTPDAPEPDILKVMDMQSPYWQRSAAPIENRWRTIAKDSMAQENVGMYAGNQPERTLMALGSRAVPTFHSVKAYGHDKKNRVDYVSLIYAVTYQTDGGEKETFFVTLALKRTQDADTTTVANQKTKMAGWGVSALKGPVLPKEFGGDDT